MRHLSVLSADANDVPCDQNAKRNGKDQNDGPDVHDAHRQSLQLLVFKGKGR